jgi:hypothetical protein
MPVPSCEIFCATRGLEPSGRQGSAMDRDNAVDGPIPSVDKSECCSPPAAPRLARAGLVRHWALAAAPVEES